MRGWLHIPNTMQRHILHEAHDSPAGAHFSADGTCLRMNDWYFMKQMWRNTQPDDGGCDVFP